MKSTVAIVGSHPRTREAFDFSRTDCDVWLFNEAISNKGNTWAKRADAIFQMHIPVIWQNPNNRNDNGHYEWLKTQTEVPVIYMQEAYPDVPRAVKYPLADVRALLNDNPDHFLSSSVPQAMGLAILQGYKRIEVYGVAMETNTEYRWQREGVAFWRGFAMGRGIDFYFADPTYRCPLYGYDGEVVIPYEDFNKRIEELTPAIQQLTEKYKRAAEVVNDAANAFEAGDNDPEKLVPKVSHLVSIGQELGKLDGAKQENEKYVKKANEMRGVSGEYAFSRQEFEGSAAQLQKNASELQIQFAAIGGQLGMVHNLVTKAAKGSPKRAKALENYQRLLQDYFRCNNIVAVYRGAAAENMRYMERLDHGIRAAGGEKSEEVILESLNA